MSVQVKSLVIIKDRDLMESICYIKTNTITIIYHIYIAPFASVNQIKAVWIYYVALQLVSVEQYYLCYDVHVDYIQCRLMSAGSKNRTRNSAITNPIINCFLGLNDKFKVTSFL